MNLNLTIVQLMVGLALFLPQAGISDQTDKRLEELFATLQGNADDDVLQEAELKRWELWFESGKQDIDVLMEKAGNAVEKGQLVFAESIYSQVIERLPEFSEGWNRRATVRFYQQDYDGSLEDIERTLRLEPRHFGSVWGLGMILGLRKEFSRAILAFERLLEIKPNSRDAKPRIDLLKQEMIKQEV